MTDRGALLHNMSVPPSSVVKYAGLNDLSSSLDRSRSRINPRASDVFGTAVRFVVPDDVPREGARALLEYLGVSPGPRPEAQLCRLIDARARELPLPDGCVVVTDGNRHRVIWNDLLSVLAVLAKCSSTVWLRAKTPSISSALARREATLLVPPGFANDLPGENACQ